MEKAGMVEWRQMADDDVFMVFFSFKLGAEVKIWATPFFSGGLGLVFGWTWVFFWLSWICQRGDKRIPSSKIVKVRLIHWFDSLPIDLTVSAWWVTSSSWFRNPDSAPVLRGYLIRSYLWRKSAFGSAYPKGGEPKRSSFPFQDDIIF